MKLLSPEASLSSQVEEGESSLMNQPHPPIALDVLHLGEELVHETSGMPLTTLCSN